MFDKVTPPISPSKTLRMRLVRLMPRRFELSSTKIKKTMITKAIATRTTRKKYSALWMVKRSSWNPYTYPWKPRGAVKEGGEKKRTRRIPRKWEMEDRLRLLHQQQQRIQTTSGHISRRNKVSAKQEGSLCT